MRPPTTVQLLVTKSSNGIFSSSVPFTNCALIAPNRPLAARTPIADVRISVGKDSQDRQSTGEGIKWNHLCDGYSVDSK